MILDSEGVGLGAMFKPYVAKLLQHIWDVPYHIGSPVTNTELYEWYKAYAEENALTSVSKTSIILEMVKLSDLGIVAFREESGKGGYRKLYYQAMSPIQFSFWVKETFNAKMDEMFTGPWWKTHGSAPTAKKVNRDV